MSQRFQLKARTVDGLRLLMNNICEKHERAPISDDVLIWFVCMRKAALLVEDGTKSIAHLLNDGTMRINSLRDVREYIDGYFDTDCDDDYAEGEQEGYFVEAVYRFLGVDPCPK